MESCGTARVTRIVGTEAEVVLERSSACGHCHAADLCDAFSNRSVFDPEYGIMGIPTFVILDREGTIKLIQTGVGLKAQKRRMIKKLLK